MYSSLTTGMPRTHIAFLQDAASSSIMVSTHIPPILGGKQHYNLKTHIKNDRKFCIGGHLTQMEKISDLNAMSSILGVRILA